MVLDYLEREKERQAFLESRERAKEKKASEGILHEKQHPGKKEGMEGYRQQRKEQTKEKRMQEIFTMESAYGKISLGMNEKKETALVIKRDKYQNGPTMEQGKKEVNAENSYSWRGKAGDRELNRKAPVESAFVLHGTEKNINESRFQGNTLLNETEKFGERTGQHAILSMLGPEIGRDREDGERAAVHAKIAGRMELAIKQQLKKPDSERLRMTAESPLKVQVAARDQGAGEGTKDDEDVSGAPMDQPAEE